MNCDDCKGTGKITLLITTKTCTTCNGTGQKIMVTYEQADFSLINLTKYQTKVNEGDWDCLKNYADELRVRLNIPPAFTIEPTDPDTDNSTPFFFPDAPDA